MKITFQGAAQTVTGSQILIEVNNQRLLLECGLFQGKREETYFQNRTFHFPIDQLDAVVLSHAHIDHSGNLPNLVKMGYRGKIYCTDATAELAGVMLEDSGHIQEADVEFLNKRLLRAGKPTVKPLYSIADAKRVANHFASMPYDRPFEPVKGVTVRLVDAGHILGSAAIVMDVREEGRSYRVWFSGDIGRENLPLLRDPQLPVSADYLIMESTYGDKPHRSAEQAYTEFREVVLQTAKRGGKVIIPAFAVGRTQEIVYMLNQMITNGDLPHLPVYVDSPLAVNTSKVFQRHEDCYDDETRSFVRENRHPALNFKGLHYVGSVEESKAINDRPGPMIIISASGMAETGRILHHLRNNIENERNTVMIVSWQAPYTLGRRLAERAEVVRIFGEEFPVRAQVATIGGLSAHAGQQGLVRYACESRPSLKRIFLVHGEPPASLTLMRLLKERGLENIEYPEQRQEFVI